ncbi:hypothetical protein ACVWYN_003217 [Pedobacter sp. UYP24]
MITTLVINRLETVQDKLNRLAEKWTVTSSSLENQIGRLEALFRCGSFIINQSNVNTLENLRNLVGKLKTHLKNQIMDIKANLNHPFYNADFALDSANLKLSSEIDILIAKTYTFKRSIFDKKDHCKKLF